MRPFSLEETRRFRQTERENSKYVCPGGKNATDGQTKLEICLSGQVISTDGGTKFKICLS